MGPITSSLRFDVTAADSASEKFKNLADKVEKVRRELELLDKAKANPKVKLDGAEAALADVNRIRQGMAGLGDVRVKVKLDAPGAADIRRVERLRDALRELGTVNGDQRIRIGVEGLDAATPNIIRRTAKALAELKAVGDVRIRIDLDGAAEALAALLAIRRELRGLPDTTTTRVRVEHNDVMQAMRAVNRLGGALALLAVPGSLAAGVQLIGALVASIGELSGVAGLIPAGLVAGGVAAGALAVGLSGVGDAFKELDTADKASAAGASAAASARTAAAERIRSAQESLAQAQLSADRESVDGARQVSDARRALADAQVSAAERIQSAEQDLADAQTQSAERVASAQRALADAQEQALERVSSAQQSLADAQDRYAADVVAGSKAVEEAQANAASSAERAARSVASAERDVTDAQRDRLDAQTDLTRAVMDAREAQEDLTLSLSGAALREERAVLDLQKAQEKLASAQASGVGGRDLQDLDLDAREAAQSLAEIRERYGDLQAEAADAAKTGIEGSAGVVAAQRRVEDATTKVGDAEQNLTDARDASATSAQDSSDRIAAAQANLADVVTRGSRSVAAAQTALTKAQTQGARDVADAQDALVKAQSDGARRVSDAQKSLTKAELDGARQVSDAREQLARTAESTGRQQTDAVARVVKAQRELSTALADTGKAADAAGAKATVAFDKLSGNAKALVTTVRSLRPAWDAVRLDVQQRLLAGISGETRDLAGKYLPLLQKGLGGTATEINLGARLFTTWAKSSKTLGDTSTQFDNITRSAHNFAPAGVNVAAALTDIATVGSGELPGISTKITDMTGRFREFISTAREDGSLQAWIQRGEVAFGHVASTIGNVGGIFGSVFDAAENNGLQFLGVLDRVTAGVDDFLNTTEGRQGLDDLFRTAREGSDALLPGLKELAVDAAKFVSEFSNTGGVREAGDVITEVVKIVGPLLPQLGKLAGEAIGDIAQGAQTAGALIAPVVAGISGLLDILGPVAPAALAMGAAFFVLGPVNALVTALGVRLQALAISSGLAATGSTAVATTFSRIGTALPFIGAGIILVSKAVEQATGDLEGYADGFIKGGDAARKAAADLAEHNAHFREGSILGDMFRISQADVNAEIEKQISLLPPLEQATARVHLAQTAYNDAVRDFGAASPQAQAAQQSLTTAVDKEKLAQDDAKRATESHTDAIKRQTDEAAAASNADLAYQQSLIRIAESQDRVTEATSQYGAASRQAKSAVLDAVGANLSAADAARRVAQANAEARGETNAAEQGANAYARVLIDLAGKTNGPVRQALLGYVGNLSESQRLAAGAAWETGTFRNTINSVPASKSTRFDTPGLDQGIRSVTDFYNGLAKLPKILGINFSTAFSTTPRAAGGIIPRRFASGGIAGVLPGYTPGRDIYTVPFAGGGVAELGGGEAIMRPEWTLAVGKRFVDAGNAAARSGGVEGARRFMTAAAGGDGASLQGVARSATGGDSGPAIVAAIAKLGADLRQVQRTVSISQTFNGITDKTAAAKSAQALRTDAALGVFG